MKIMAIDYGDAHTGVAFSDPTGFLTGTTTTIPVSYTHLDVYKRQGPASGRWLSWACLLFLV